MQLNEKDKYRTIKTEILEIVKSINVDNITSSTDTNAKILDSLISILNKEKITNELDSVLKNKYIKDDINEIADQIVFAPLTLSYKLDFIQNLKEDKVINSNILITPGVYTFDEFVYNSTNNKKITTMFDSFKVRSNMKGPFEHAINMFSATAELSDNKGDIIVGNKRVEIKASTTKKSKNCGRLGDSSLLPGGNQIESILFSFSALKEQIEEGRKNAKTLNLSNFVDYLENAGLPTYTKKEISYEVFTTIFNSYGVTIADEILKEDSNKESIRQAYVTANYNWYKDGKYNSGWDYLVAIAPGRNRVIVTETSTDFLNSPFGKRSPSILTSGKPMEMLTSLDILAP